MNKNEGVISMNELTNTTPQWNEGNSRTFIDLADILVPGRAEQTATLLHLIPAQPDEAFTIVELASGAGILAQAILEKFPACHYIALDPSPTMREQIRHTLTPFSNRLEIGSFELSESAWRTALPTPLRCIVSSLSVHHLSDEGKRQLF